MKKAFSLIEMIIIIAVLGILASIVVPTFKSYTQQVKEATAKDHLRTLRTIIEVYTAQNDGVPPGYPDNDVLKAPTAVRFTELMTSTVVSGNGFTNCIVKFPENPFSNKSSIKIIGNVETFPSAPVQTDLFGWIYKPATKNIRLNYNGTDSQGVRYFDY